MAVYYINLILILALAFPLCVYKPNKIKTITYLAVTFGYMWFLATFRSGIGFDYQSYIDIFETIRTAEGLNALLALPQEPGFVLLSKVMTFFVSTPTAMYGVYSALILIPVAIFIYLNCKDVWLSVWLYVTLTHFYGLMNFIRQSLACSVVLLGYHFLKKRRPVPYLLVVLLGACFHKSALIMIPVYFICTIPLTPKVGAIYAGGTLALYFSSGFIIDKVTDYIMTGYKNSIYLQSISPGNIAASLVFLIVPLSLFGACLALQFTWKKRDPQAVILLNMLLYSCIGWLFITKHFILERFSQYIYIMAIVAVPAAIASLKSPEEDHIRLAKMKAESKGKGKGKEEAHKIKQLSQDISDHQKYYWSAVVALILLTLIYNEFGTHVNRFHGVFPYQSVLEWLN